MTTQLVPLNLDQLPAHLIEGAAAINADLGGAVKAKFPVMSLKGKSWTIIRDKDNKEVLTNDDGDPRSSIEVVILRVNGKESKVFYAEEYVDGSAMSPTCYSNNGDVPEADSREMQANSCSVCKHNVWGTGRNGKGFGCASSKRLAVAAPDQLDDPMLIRVPGGSITALKEYNKSLRGYPYNSVVTKIKFDPSSPVPILQFTPVGALPSAVYGLAKEQYDSELVLAITGVNVAPVEPSTKPAQMELPHVPPAPKAAGVPLTAAPPAKAEKKAAPAKVVKEGGDISAALDDVLSGLDI